MFLYIKYMYISGLFCLAKRNETKPGNIKQN